MQRVTREAGKGGGEADGAVAVEGEFDPDFGKEWDPEYEPPLPVWGPPSGSASGYMLDYYKPA